MCLFVWYTRISLSEVGLRPCSGNQPTWAGAVGGCMYGNDGILGFVFDFDQERSMAGLCRRGKRGGCNLCCGGFFWFLIRLS